MVKIFTTGKWNQEPYMSSLAQSELATKHQIVPMGPSLEAEMEGESIHSSLIKIAPKGALIRSGKGTFDLSIFDVDKVKHLEHFDMPVPSYKEGVMDEVVLNQLITLKEKISKLGLETIIITGSFYYHIRGVGYLGFEALEDKGDISKYFGKPCCLAIRNFHEGDPSQMTKATFCRKVDGKFNGIDFGTGKCSVGATGIQVNISTTDMKTTVQNTFNLLEMAKAAGHTFI